MERFKNDCGQVPDHIQTLISGHSQAAKTALEQGAEYSIAALCVRSKTQFSTVLGRLALQLPYKP